MSLQQCVKCGDKYSLDVMKDSKCWHCRTEERFTAFARECGLECYPDPSGERYVYHLGGDCAGKKSECVHLIDDLWNALVRAKGKEGDGLMIGED